MHQDDRAYMLASLKAVDYVVLFDEETPYELIRRIAPDVLTKGADYQGKPIAGSELVPDVRLISLVEGRSTSSMIEQILAAA
jgi:D-beta-D-heptose 7-phosphate kinase/D-beta-D-heptose 1-phosphate adenosyltransferase